MRGPAPYWIDSNDNQYRFPEVRLALREPDGLLAVGGDLCPERLKSAYINGIFPWYNEDQPILWWSPDPRAVLYPTHLKISRSLRKTINKRRFKITIDKAFNDVIDACRMPRQDSDGTWITTDMRNAYSNLFALGHAHSIEAWLDGELVGGLYGVAYGQVFFGESMFARATDASKVAFAVFTTQLKHWNYKLIDCQVSSKHLTSLGAEDIPREHFVRLLQKYCHLPSHPKSWRIELQ